VRNLVRRRLREAMRTCLPDLVPGYDLVIISRPALADQSFAALGGALTQQLRHARLLTRIGPS
jgi:ribonuclease P protein component